MSRIEENKKLIEWAQETSNDIASNPLMSKEIAVDIINTIKLTTLIDISASLAVIADSMVKEEKNE